LWRAYGFLDLPVDAALPSEVAGEDEMVDPAVAPVEAIDIFKLRRGGALKPPPPAPKLRGPPVGTMPLVSVAKFNTLQDKARCEEIVRVAKKFEEAH
jgi:hypothetical protein